MSDVVEEDRKPQETLEQAVERLTLENQILRSRNTTQTSMIERGHEHYNPAMFLHMEGVILRQRETLKNMSNSLWRRRQLIRSLREKIAFYEIKERRRSRQVVGDGMAKVAATG